MKQLKSICLLLMMAVLPLSVQAGEASKDESLNISEIVLEHLSDSYEWHIATYQGKHIGFPLPIIIKSSQTGEWHFCTAHSLPQGFFFNPEAHGKIYEKMADGSIERPLDLSITRNVLQIWIVVAVLLVVFLSCARWYKKHDKTSNAPGGFIGAVELLVMMINDDVIKASIGEKHYKPYAPYLLTVFFFILVTNLLGLLPIFPGGSNVTGNINITFFLAFCTFLAINLFGNLFANMMAGHAMILSFSCVIFLGWTLGVGMGIGLNLFSLVMLLFMNALELLVAFVQAYVFTMLSAVFIGLAHQEHHEE